MKAGWKIFWFGVAVFAVSFGAERLLVGDVHPAGGGAQLQVGPGRAGPRPPLHNPGRSAGDLRARAPAGR